MFPKDFSFINYGLEYNYYSYSENCQCDYICRCRVIKDAGITEVNIADIAQYILSRCYHYFSNAPEKFSDLSHYAFERILTANKLYEPDFWNIEISGGYYGEEIDDIVFNNWDDLNPKIQYFLECQDDDQRILFALNEEYGWHKYEDFTFSLEEINLEKVNTFNELHLNECIKNDKDYYQSHYQSYLKNKKWLKSPDHYGLCLVRGEESFTLIDGHHRFAAAVKSGIKTAKMVVGHKKDPNVKL